MIIRDVRRNMKWLYLSAKQIRKSSVDLEIPILKVNKMHCVLCTLLLIPINFFFPKLFMNKLLLQEFLIGSFRFLSFTRINTPFVPLHSECVLFNRMNIVGLVLVVQNQAWFFSEQLCEVNSTALIWEDEKKLL